MRAAPWLKHPHERSLSPRRNSPRNIRERAVGTAENGSTRDSSEAVPTAAKEDVCFSLAIRQQFQEPAFIAAKKVLSGSLIYELRCLKVVDTFRISGGNLALILRRSEKVTQFRSR